nr:endolytic transglycosylase MltG [Nakamurella flavida]
MRRRRRRSTLVALTVLVALVAGLAVGFTIWRKSVTTIPDYVGAGAQWTVVRVQSGDTLDSIAATLTDAGVVASDEAFTATAAQDADVKALRPGYYKVRVGASAAEAANTLVDPANRVGALRLIPGRQLADVATSADGVANGSVPGYVTQIAEAACVPLDEAGTDRSACFSADDLWAAAETTDPAQLGVVEWAVDAVRAAPDPRKRLEGMILPGDYNVPPNQSAVDTLKSVVTASAASWYTSDVVARSASTGLTPYQVAVAASLVEREGITADMPKVARVIDNRLAVDMRLQFDSTVNYALDRAQIATSSADRDTAGPYNTYLNTGLPPTPISSPGPDAIAATLAPAQGPWMYFVKIDQTGASCFSVTLPEHEACIEQARANGVFG